MIASYFALIGLAISSLTSRRAFAMGGAVALLVASERHQRRAVGPRRVDDKVLVIALPVIPVILAQRMFPDAEDRAAAVDGGLAGAYLVVCGVSLLVLLLRYRRADG